MLKTVLNNLLQPSRTRAPKDLPAIPPAFRGVIQHKASLCTGCKTCAFVCAPEAITFEENADVSVFWQFFAGKCTFCGLCAAYCPTKAISNSTVLPVVSGDQSAHHFRSEMPLTPCARCGTPHVPVPAETLPNIAAEERELCWECRRKLASERIRDAFIGNNASKGGEKNADS